MRRASRSFRDRAVEGIPGLSFRLHRQAGLPANLPQQWCAIILLVDPFSPDRDSDWADPECGSLEGGNWSARTRAESCAANHRALHFTNECSRSSHFS
jgi:hypothetical protein